MKWALVLVLAALSLVACGKRGASPADVSSAEPPASMRTVELPEPRRQGEMSLDRALDERASLRSFAPDPLSEGEMSQLLWAAQGVTRPDSGGRTAPSAYGLYPLEVYVADARGTWRYVPRAHALEQIGDRDVRGELAEAAAGQSWIADAPTVFVFTVSEKEMADKDKARAQRFVAMEAGHACQNLLLEATALGLGGTSVGSVSEPKVSGILGLPRDRYPVYVVPIGRPR